MSAAYRVVPGPTLLAHLTDGPGLAAHRDRYGPVSPASSAELAQVAARGQLRGRGGAGFPFAEKITAVSAALGRGPRRRAVVVVNAAEGEPLSSKDEALLGCAPHRVLDGAALSAQAVRARGVHVVVGRDRPQAQAALARAVEERRAAGEPLAWRVHLADAAYVSGQSSAVLQLLAGRPGLPVTTVEPAARAGLRGRPTLLSNAETFAQLWALSATGGGYAPVREGIGEAAPGTVLLTLSGWGSTQPRRVVEVPIGTPWEAVLTPPEPELPVLVGGYHGAWVGPGQLRGSRVTGDVVGAGVVVTTPAGSCPVAITAAVAAYLGEQSARRCGPCRFGLPALAEAVDGLARGADGALSRVEQLVGSVRGRGACAHPDGTARLVASLLAACPQEVRAHRRGRCLGTTGAEGAPSDREREALPAAGAR